MRSSIVILFSFRYWIIRVIQESVEKILRFKHWLYSQFLGEHTLTMLILSNRLITAALGGICPDKLPVRFLVTMVHLEDGNSPFCGVLVATIL